MKYICKQCGKEFEITDGEAEFYRSKGLNMPKRCKECREKNKAEKSGGSTAETEPKSTTRMPMHQQSSGQTISSKTIKIAASVIAAVLVVVAGLVSLANRNSSDKSTNAETSANFSYSSYEDYDYDYDDSEDEYTDYEEAEEVEEEAKEAQTEASSVEATADNTSAKQTTDKWITTRQSTIKQTTTRQSTTKQATTRQSTAKQTTAKSSGISESGSYFSKNDVALYIHTYGHLPSNFITKKQAEALGWNGGSVQKYAPGKAIGGDYYGNYEGLLPEGKTYHECDINTDGKSSRGAERIIYSTDGSIYYTSDHYNTFTKLY